jgi:dTDP-4-dehydrorhamnose 3,5-epimerase-like enzyme
MMTIQSLQLLSDGLNILWKDPEINIDWGLDGADPLLSKKDEGGALINYSDLFD